MFSPYVSLKGGKGVATAAGSFLALAPHRLGDDAAPDGRLHGPVEIAGVAVGQAQEAVAVPLPPAIARLCQE